MSYFHRGLKKYKGLRYVSLLFGRLGGLLQRTLSYLDMKSAIAVMSLTSVEEKNC